MSAHSTPQRAVAALVTVRAFESELCDFGRTSEFTLNVFTELAPDGNVRD